MLSTLSDMAAIDDETERNCFCIRREAGWISISQTQFPHQNLRPWWLRILRMSCFFATYKQNHQIGISGTRNFCTKLTTDSNSDGQIEPKNSLFVKFPRHFWCAKFSQLFGVWAVGFGGPEAISNQDGLRMWRWIYLLCLIMLVLIIIKTLVCRFSNWREGSYRQGRNIPLLFGLRNWLMQIDE